MSELLDKLEHLRIEREYLLVQWEKAIAAALDAAPDLKEQVETYKQTAEGIDKEMSEIEEHAKRIALEQSTDLVGQRVKIQWFPGRDTWDAQALESYADMYPEILACKKKGQPFTKILWKK